MPAKVLIIDDEEKLRNLIARILKLEGYSITEAGSLGNARKSMKADEPDVVLCDVKLPDGSGVDFVSELKREHPFTEVILLTAYGNIPDGIQAMKNGAFDYITKGDDNNRLIPLLSRAMEKVQLQKRVHQLEKLIDTPKNFSTIIGTSRHMQDAISLAKKVAATDTTVLLLGETGTGKDIFSQAIHNEGGRAKKTFVAVNCSAFSRELLESELFGHTAGAFTGAIKDKKGLIEEANEGTLFLDEIGEMSIELQSRLLRVLETGEFIKVGDTKVKKANVRLIAATNRNLEDQIRKGEFREDLYYRLNVFTIELPPLRERKGDIPLLAQHFLNLFTEKSAFKISGFTEDALKLLAGYSWKGNIRELRNVIERAVILENSQKITPLSLPYELRHTQNVGRNSLELSSVEKNHIRKVLDYTGNNKTETARLLNIGLTTLYRKMEEYGIEK